MKFLGAIILHVKDVLIVIAGLVLIALVFSGWAMFQSWKQSAGIPPVGNEPVVPTMDAKLCPDGSYVGRVGPRCEFAPCPTGSDNFESQ